MHQVEDGFNITALVVALIAVILRFTVIVLRGQSFKTDDILLGACWIPTAITCIWITIVMPFSYVTVRKCGLLEMLYALSMWPMRVSAIMLYRRIFHDRDLTRVRTVSFLCFFVLYMMLILAGIVTLPFRRGGQSPADDARELLDIVRITQSACSVVLSALLILLPLPWILPIKVSHSTSWVKIGLTFVMVFLSFLAGAFRLGYSISTTVFRDYRDHIAIWSCLELSFNIIALCIPSRPLDQSTRPERLFPSAQAFLVRAWDAWQMLGKDDGTTRDPENQPLIPSSRAAPSEPYRPWEQGVPQVSVTAPAPESSASGQVAAHQSEEATASTDQPAAQ